MDLEAFGWLLSPDGQRLLAAAEQAYDAHPNDPVRAASALRGEESAARVAHPYDDFC